MGLMQAIELVVDETSGDRTPDEGADEPRLRGDEQARPPHRQGRPLGQRVPHRAAAQRQPRRRRGGARDHPRVVRGRRGALSRPASEPRGPEGRIWSPKGQIMTARDASSASTDPRSIDRMVAAPRPHWVGDGFSSAGLLLRDPGRRAEAEPVSAARLRRAAGVPADGERAARRRPASASRVRDRHDRVPGQRRAPRHDREAAESSARRRPVDDGGLRDPAPGVPRGELGAERRHDADGADLGQPAARRTRWTRPATRPSRRTGSASRSCATSAGTVRVIAGEYLGVRGPAKTFTPVTMLDIRLEGMGRADFDVPARHNAALLVMKGEVAVNGEAASENELRRSSRTQASASPSRRAPTETPSSSCSPASRSTSPSSPTVRSS